MKTKTTKIAGILVTLFMLVTMLGIFSLTASAVDDITVTIDTGASVTLKDTDSDGYYEIGSADELYAFAAAVNGGNTAIKAKLTADITVNSGVLVEGALAADPTGFRVWTPIGNFDYQYIGTFDGNNKTVSGLYFNDNTVNYVGLFGCVGAGGVVKNVGVLDSYFNANYYVGGVAGYNSYGTVENCYNEGKVSGSSRVGGVVGFNEANSTIENCYNTGDVSGTGDYVGGVVGYNFEGTVENCYNEGAVSGAYCVGGVAGDNSINGTVKNCYNVGDVSGSSRVGGVVGYNQYGNVENCYYLETDEINTDLGGIEGADVDGSAEAKTDAQFKSGEVAYLLNGDQSTIVFGQTIGTDASPTLGGARVYYGYTTCKDSQTAPIYTNDSGASETKPSHSFDENGFCTLCDGYQPAELVDGVYQIANAGQLYWFAEQVNSGNTTINGILTANVTVNSDVLAEMAKDTPDPTGFRAWTPIGNFNNRYTGTFDGDGHTVSGLYFNNTSIDNVGLFGCVGENGVVKNGVVKNVGVIDSYFKGKNYVGGVVGENYGTVTNCYNEGAVSGTGIRVGGVVGYNSINGTVENCYNEGDVSGYIYVGGVVGDNNGTTVENCHNKGGVSGTGNYVGGVVGYNDDGTVENCYNKGDVSGASSYVGGVVGFNSGGTVTNCYNVDAVSGTNNYVGGVVGFNEANSTIENCYNTGDVSGASSVGGVVGTNSEGTVTNCYYLSGTASGGIEGADKEGQADAKTDAQFKSGEVAYLLNGDQSTIVFGQTIGTDALPVLDGETVYRNRTGGCNDASYTYEYSNTEEAPVTTHSFDENGFCTLCDDGYEPAEQNAEGYYEIGNAGQLYWFAQQVNSGNTTINAILTANVTVNSDVLAEMAKDTPDTTGFRAWTPIGNYDYRYTGTFDGNNKTVSGLYFNDTSVSYVGLFGYVEEGGVVKNVGVLDSYFNANFFVGGVVGDNFKGTVENCYNEGDVSGDTCVGGVVGENYGTVESSYNTGDVSGSYNVGGVVGYNNGTIESSYNTGDVSGTNNYVGGVVGYNNSTIESSYNTGDVSGTNNYVGGVVGYNSGTVANCYNTGAVSGTGNSVGGVVGYNQYGTVKNCYYLETDEINKDLGGIDGADVDGSAEAKTDAQFKSGEVAYLLGSAFGQTVDADGETPDALPVLGGARVYYGYTTCKDSQTAPIYTNDSGASDTKPSHSFDENGFCTVCGGYEAAELVDGVYQIANAGQLYWFAQQVNSGNTTINAILTANVVVNADVLAEMAKDTPDTTGFRAWTPIGNFNNRYTGTFDGNNKTVSGLYFNNTSIDYVGLFGYVGTGGVVKNVGVIDSYFKGYDIVGGVVGYNRGTVENCYNTGDVSGTGDYVGGVVGYNSGTVESSYNTGDVSGTGDYVGGVVGTNNYGTVEKCYNKGTVSGSSFVGGVVGYNSGSTVENCYNTGDVSGTNNYVGGVVGYNQYGTVKNCYNTGAVSGKYYVGGVVGDNFEGTVENCYYLETDEINTNLGGIKGADSAGKAEAKTEEQFESGEVAYLLNGDQSTIVFGQTIGTDKLPVLGGATVYKNQTGGCTDESYIYEYSNTAKDPVTTHSFDENGFCTACDGGYQPAELVEGVYQISNAGQLYWFAQQVNIGNTSINAILTTNITVNSGVLAEMAKNTPDPAGFRGWMPIGNSDDRYAGTFDGNNKTVSGLYFNDNTVNYVGLFGCVEEGGVVKNVGVLDSYFNANYYVGGVVGRNYGGTVTNCYNTGEVSGTKNYVGGVVGDNNKGTINNCYNKGTVSGSSFVGGVVGYNNNGTVTNCYNTGEVSGTKNYVGGVVGANSDGTVENCYNEGEVSGTNYVGGVVGYNFEGTVKNCYNVGDVSGNTYVGGVVGDNNNGTVENCYYLKTDEINTNLGGINGADAAGQAEAKTKAQFESGEVAYLLGSAFGQTVDADGETPDALPVLGGATVYRNQTGGCNDESYVYGYSNTAKDPVITHTHAYTADGATISCDCKYCEEPFGTLTVSAEGKTYDGTAVTVTVIKTGIFEEIEIEPTYQKDGAAFEGELVGAGTYVATVTYEGASASVEFVIEKADVTLEVTAPVSSVLPGNNILLTVKADNDEVSGFYAVAGTLYTADGLVVKISDEAVIGQDSITVTVKLDESDNYNAAEATITLDVGMPDVSGELAELAEDINALNEMIENKADASEIAEKLEQINGKITGLEENGATDAELAAAKTELTEAYTAAVAQVQQNLNDAKTELQNAINANEADIEDKVAKLDEAYKTADTLINSEIADLKTEDTAIKQSITALEGAMNSADEALQDAIDQVQQNLDDAKTELQNAINANEADIEDKVAKLDEAYKAADTLINSEIADLKTEDTAIKQSITALEGAMNSADEALESAIEQVQQNLNDAKTELQNAINANETDIENKVAKLDEAYKAADTLINSEIADLKTEDTAIKQSITDLESSMNSADEALQDAIEQVQQNLNDAKAELDKVIADGDKANADALTEAVTNLNGALDAAKAALEATDAANKAELEAALAEAETTLTEAINTVQQNLDDAKAELDKVIAEGDKANADALAEAVTNLNGALDAAKAALEATDAANKAELEAALAEAEDTLTEAINTVQTNLDDAKAELDKVIADGDKANADALAEAVTNLNGALDAAKAALEATDAANKAALEAALAEAESTLTEAINTVQQNLDNAKAELDKVIADGDKANADALTEAVTNLNGALDVAKAALEATDAANKAELEAALAEAETTLTEAINTVQTNLDNAKAELDKVIAEGDKANADALTEAVTNLNGALDAAKAALEATDAANKAELEAALAEAETTLTEAINAVQTNLDNAKAELDKVIAEGDKANADALTEAVTNLNGALDAAKAALEATDAANKAELGEQISEAYSSLDAVIKAVQKELDELKAEIAQKDSEFDSVYAENQAALEAKDKELQTFVIIVSVVSGVALCGSGAFVVWFFIDRKKKF